MHLWLLRHGSPAHYFRLCRLCAMCTTHCCVHVKLTFLPRITCVSDVNCRCPYSSVAAVGPGITLAVHLLLH